MLWECALRFGVGFGPDGGLAAGPCERTYPAVAGASHFRRGKDEIEAGPLNLPRPLPDEDLFHAGQKIIGTAIQ